MLLEVVPNKVYTEGKSLAQKWSSNTFTFKSPTSSCPALHLFSFTFQIQIFTKSFPFYLLKSFQIHPFLLISTANCQLVPVTICFPARTTEYSFYHFSFCFFCNQHSPSDVFKIEIRISHLRLKTIRNRNESMRFCSLVLACVSVSSPTQQPHFLSGSHQPSFSFLNIPWLCRQSLYMLVPFPVMFLLNNLDSSFGSPDSITSLGELSLIQSGSDIPVNNLSKPRIFSLRTFTSIVILHRKCQYSQQIRSSRRKGSHPFVFIWYPKHLSQ